MIRADSGLEAGSRVDTLDGEALGELVERATANEYAREILTSTLTAWYAGIPMLRVESREDAVDPMYYTRYLFLSGETLYTLVFMESWEPSADEAAFFDAVAASLSISGEAAASADPPSNQNAVILAVIVVVGLVALIIIAVSVILILHLARRQLSDAPRSSDDGSAASPRSGAQPPSAPRQCARCGGTLRESDRYCSGLRRAGGMIRYRDRSGRTRPGLAISSISSRFPNVCYNEVSKRSVRGRAVPYEGVVSICEF
jgi:hypothetical protein